MISWSCDVNTKRNIKVNGKLGGEFDVSVGVHQDPLLGPLLFIMVLEALSQDCRCGLPMGMINHKLLNKCRGAYLIFRFFCVALIWKWRLFQSWENDNTKKILPRLFIYFSNQFTALCPHLHRRYHQLVVHHLSHLQRPTQ